MWGRLRRALGGALLVCVAAASANAQEPPPALTGAVNDFAGVIDRESARAIDTLSRSLQQASGDVVVVATIDTYAPYGDIREYAVRMFENHGRGIGQRGRDNGLLIVLAVEDRRVWVEVGYDLEQFVTDGFAGQISREDMTPAFRRGEYGAGLLAGVSRIVTRVAEGRNVKLEGVRMTPIRRGAPQPGGGVFLALLILFVAISAIAGRIRGRRRGRPWGGGPWSGWHSGVGPFGGGGFGGFGGGGFGGGFGGFGGGRSGGGGGGGSW